MTIQSIGNDVRSIEDFLNRIADLDIDQIVVVVNHGKDFMTFSHDVEHADNVVCKDFLNIGAELLQRYAKGDYGHKTEQ